MNKLRGTLLGLFSIFQAAEIQSQSIFEMRDEESPSVFQGPTPIESGPSLDTPIRSGEWQSTGPTGFDLEAAFRNIEFRCPSIPSQFSISCLRRNQNEFIVLDPGHDDSPISMRSEGYLRAGDREMVFARPLIHEGKLNMVVAWATYELMKRCWAKTSEDLRWIDQNVQLSRYPGEKRFGEYGFQSGRNSKVGGAIAFDATNRKEWTNALLENWSRRTQSQATSKAIVNSIHANSSGGVYDSNDFAWMIIPKNASQGSRNLGLAMAAGVSHMMSAYFRSQSGDSNEVKSLKKAVAPTYSYSNIRVHAHTRDLAMLAPDLGGALTKKALLEGFFMDGKAGNIVHRELLAKRKSLFFKRKGRTVAGYYVSDLYLNYAQAVLQGLSRLGTGCKK